MTLFSFYHPELTEAGCDEAGRGCLAGPVVAAAVIFPKDYIHKDLNDSKKLSEKKRNLLRKDIEREAVAYAVSFVDNQEIDKINIVKASMKAMHLSLKKLMPAPGFIIVDGNYFIPFQNIPHQCHVKGDGKYLSIAAASILAKTYRDEYMIKLNEEFPGYFWDRNKGYGTREHCKAIEQNGLTVFHRKTFCTGFAQLTLGI